MRSQLESGHRNISIHALRKESDQEPDVSARLDNIISIHALRKESDDVAPNKRLEAIIFQSTLSVRRATWRTPANQLVSNDFNPRSP